jgi:hypothetical protein
VTLLRFSEHSSGPWRVSHCEKEKCSSIVLSYAFKDSRISQKLVSTLCLVQSHSIVYNFSFIISRSACFLTWCESNLTYLGILLIESHSTLGLIITLATEQLFKALGFYLRHVEPPTE